MTTTQKPQEPQKRIRRVRKVRFPVMLTGIRVSEEMLAQLGEYCDATGATQAEAVRDGLELLIRRAKRAAASAA